MKKYYLTTEKFFGIKIDHNHSAQFELNRESRVNRERTRRCHRGRKPHIATFFNA